MRIKYTAGQKIAQFLGLGVLGGGVCGGVCLYRGDENTYRKLCSLLHLVDGESAHKTAIWALSNGFYFKDRSEQPKELENKLWGLHFKNPIGIAAGFDKHGEAVQGLSDIGFGFVEVGSVTPKAQLGNPQPRVFRLDSDGAVINRYGFNSEGHVKVKERLCSVKKNNYDGILGINLGKNKTSPSASEDYSSGVKMFGAIADYLVINISSPNTPGLRSLQGKEDLSKLIKSVLSARQELKLANPPPILVKISPDLTDDDKVDIADVVMSEETKIDGLIISNTTLSRPDTLTSTSKSEQGGLSGAPLASLSTSTIRDMYRLTKGLIPIIGVGGVSSGSDAWEKVLAGASLVQLYTAMVYNGPPVVSKVRRELAELFASSKYKNISEAVGADHKTKAC